MAYIVKMIYTFPQNEPFPPDDSKRFPVTTEVRELREQFIKDGKILATDGYFSTDAFTGINTVVFRSQEDFNEWSSNPIVAEFFKQRDEFLSSHGISKSSEFAVT
jgi:hypothetical protein